jgi:hypothetical protein
MKEKYSSANMTLDGEFEDNQADIYVMELRVRFLW